MATITLRGDTTGTVLGDGTRRRATSHHDISLDTWSRADTLLTQMLAEQDRLATNGHPLTAFLGRHERVRRPLLTQTGI
ncbi:hypothetical protein D6789_02125 [Candidatus Woesearchaeota archaeon]|nr:MAG: hypothetical protein D6789_02125 [Candidatus Woesearchaeota archaeon]